MSKYEDGCYGSAAGIALIGKVLAGRCSMHYTRVAAGKGSIPDGETPKTMSEVAGYVMDAKIAAITNPVDGECQITVQINSADVETGFYCTGLLLYAEDPDEGEVPYTYLVLENEPEWIRPASSIVGKLATFDIIAAVGDVDTVTAAIDPEAIATVAEVQRQIAEHNADPNAHGGTITEAVNAKVEEMAEEGEIVTPETVEEIVKAEIAKRPGGGYYGTYTVNIPAADWREAEDDNPDYDYICDVPEEEVTAELVPMGAAALGHFGTAAKAGVVNGCSTFDGYFRFYAEKIPTGDIEAVITLFSKGGKGTGGIGKGLEYDEEGNVSVKAGDGLHFDEHDALAVDKHEVVTDEDLLDEDETAGELEEILTK